MDEQEGRYGGWSRGGGCDVVKRCTMMSATISAGVVSRRRAEALRNMFEASTTTMRAVPPIDLPFTRGAS